MSNVMDQETAENPVQSGAAIFCRLPPTSRITEFMTLAFYPLFFGIVMTALISGFVGHIVGAGLGVVLAIVAITFRRWGARWALSDTEKREIQEAELGDKDSLPVAPHHNFMLHSEIFYISFEIGLIGLVATNIILTSFNFSYDNFFLFYSEYSQYVDWFFSYYNGLDKEISAHIGTIYGNRIYLIKSSSMAAFTAMSYSIVLMSVRLLFGWKRYWLYLSRVSNVLSLRNENASFLSLPVFIPTYLLTIYGLFYGGMEFFTIVGNATDANWYSFFSIFEYNLYTLGYGLSLFLLISILASHSLVILFLFSRKS